MSDRKQSGPVLDEVDLSLEAEDKDKADEEIAKLQERLYSLQVRTFLADRSAILVFEGWDASGKGGAIKRLTAMMDPRGYKVWPIAAPRENERAHNYLWRFSTRSPEKGEIAIFDRSWYGRVLVERVEGFATKAEWKRAYDEINAFERTFTGDGVAVAKFWLHIDRKTQLRRFKDREDNPIKRYKIGPDDWRNRKAWAKYAKAVQEMFDRTHQPDAPWHVIPANDKRHARREVLRICADTLERLLKSE
ncbi:MAG TPA: polyphosphate kinase [Myxococcaceae bacterium]